MVARKVRTRVVLDTNVFVRHYKTRNQRSPNRRLVRLWLEQKRLQLVLSTEIIEEYLEIFAEVLGADAETNARSRDRFEQDNRCTMVRLAKRYTESRDPDDNVFLSTARAGRADYLITNDRDLLDLPDDFSVPCRSAS